MMEPVDADDVAAMLEGLIHEETQVQEGRAQLTVAGIAALSGTGQLDFGGGEYREADERPLEPELRSQDDDYGWWSLEPGSYRVTFNESVQQRDDVLVLLQPWKRAARNGVTHATRVLHGEEPAVTLRVDAPVDIKENARLAELAVYRV